MRTSLSLGTRLRLTLVSIDSARWKMPISWGTEPLRSRGYMHLRLGFCESLRGMFVGFPRGVLMRFSRKSRKNSIGAFCSCRSSAGQGKGPNHLTSPPWRAIECLCSLHRRDTVGVQLPLRDTFCHSLERIRYIIGVEAPQWTLIGMGFF